jgi:hypothetical protein
VGWRDRDWAKFTDDEWNRIVGTRRADPIRSTTTVAGTPAVAPAGRSPQASTITLFAAALSLLATILGMLVHFRTVIHLPAKSPAPANLVNVHWRASDLSPATTPGQICVATSTLGRVCASYSAGERPADALDARLRAAGATVRSS